MVNSTVNRSWPRNAVALANDEAAKHRLRVARRATLRSRLLGEAGNLAYLGQGSLLVGYKDGRIVEPNWDYTFAMDVLRSSLLWEDLAPKARRAFERLGKPLYERLEQAVRALSVTVCLALTDLDEVSMCTNFYCVKRWVVAHGVHQPEQALSYVKWLVKCVQAVELRADIPDGESYYPGFNKRTGKVVWTPWSGELDYLDQAIKLGERPAWTLEQHRAAAQIANATRAMPYPTIRQVRASVIKTVGLITSPSPVILERDRRAYIGGLKAIKRLLESHRPNKWSKSSLTNSGCFENPRSEGGRAFVMITEARVVCDRPLDDRLIDLLAGNIDCFGETILDPAVAQIARTAARTRPVTLGDVLYCTPLEAATELSREDLELRVPKHLGNIVAWVASAQTAEYGHYTGVSTLVDGMLCFAPASRGKIRFKPHVSSLPVRADVVEESALKSRLVTAAPAGPTQLAQLVRHVLADYLSNDPFVRIGFDEADKLWEVLKVVRKLNKLPDALKIFSADLVEATYKIPFEILELNNEFMRDVLADDPVFQVFSDLFAISRREVDLRSLFDKRILREEDDVPPKLISTRGAFMGDSLAFMHLTLTLMSITWQASFASYFQGRRPLDEILHYEGYIGRPLGQSVGDDLIALADLLFGETWRGQASAIGLEMSKIDAISEDSGTFCEQYFCVPSDRSQLSDYPPESKFGEMYFLDTIKGSALAGQAKVKADGASPFFGHAKMVAKQVAWHPIERIKRRATLFLWASNFDEAKGLGRIKPFFPPELGGLGIALGNVEDLADSEELRSSYGEFLQTIVDLPFDKFMYYRTMLSSIVRANPKGVPWAANELEVAIIVSRLQTIREDDVLSQIPAWVLAKGRGDVVRFLNHNLGLYSTRDLSEILAELDAYLAYWRLELRQPFMTASPRLSRARFKSVWTQIRRDLAPSELKYSSLADLAKAFERRTFGVLFDKEDPAIREALCGMTTLTVRWGRTKTYNRSYSAANAALGA